MTKITAVVAALGMFAIAGCTKDDTSTKAPPETARKVLTVEKAPARAETPAREVGTIEVARLAKLIETKSTVAILDANGVVTRKEHGTIPTATLLSHYSDYDLKELPAEKDTKLVFFCSNEQCGASKKGATKAILAGYSDVSVMPAGIMGWEAAGQKTTRVN